MADETNDNLLGKATLHWLYNSAPLGIFITDTDLIIRTWNDWLESHTGRSAQEMVGRKLFEAIPDLVDRRFDAYYTDALAGQPRLVSEKFHGYLVNASNAKVAGGVSERMRQSARINPLICENQVVGTLTLIEDVTERVIRETALRQQVDKTAELLIAEKVSRSQAQEANRLKDEFLATISHELRTPMNAILGWAYLLRSTPLNEASMRQGIETINRNANMQAQLIEDLLDVSRIISGKMTLDVRPINVVSIIEAALDTLRLAANAKQIEIKISAGPASSLVLGDQTRLQQIIWNLLSNAIKFTPSGGRVEVGLTRKNEQLEMVITDTGQGIPPQLLPFIFDRFRQADGSTTRAQGGLGLGLAIVRHLVELHGGTVEASSAGEGKGATFTVKLPITYAGSVAEHRLPGMEILRSPELQDLHVLVVDDEADTRVLVTSILENLKCRVTTMSTAAEGFAAVQHLRPQILIADIGMPGEDGYSLIRKVRQLPADQGGDIPAAALTGYARTEDQASALLAGFNMHVPKPVDPTLLVSVVEYLAALVSKPVDRQMSA